MKFSWQVPQFKQLSLSSAIIFLIVEIQDQTWLFDAYIKCEKLQAMNNFIVLPDIWMISIYLICSCLQSYWQVILYIQLIAIQLPQSQFILSTFLNQQFLHHEQMT